MNADEFRQSFRKHFQHFGDKSQGNETAPSPNVPLTIASAADKLPPQQSNEESRPVVISVCIKGDITFGTFAMWSKKIASISSSSSTPTFPLTLLSSFQLDSTTHIVMDEKFTDVNKFLHWSSLSSLPSPEEMEIISPAWMVASLKGQSLQPCSQYRHPIQAKQKEVPMPVKSSSSSSSPTTPLPLAHPKPDQLEQPQNKRARFMCEEQPKVQPQSSDLNAHITAPLNKLLNHYMLMKDDFRAKAYKGALSVLKRLPFLIENISQIKDVRGIGKSILLKIEEILETGRLDKLEGIQSNPHANLMTMFGSVWGIGPSKAEELIRKGFLSIEDLRNRGMSELSAQQKIGLRYHEDLKLRIPREEVSRIEDVVRTHLFQCFPRTSNADGGDNDLELVTCGSYRRGKPTCGDVDILIRTKENLPPTVLLNTLVKELHQVGFLADDYALPSTKEDERKASYMGICRLCPAESHLFRHIDVKVYIASEFPFALLYFTGSDYFNRYGTLGD